jgi:hypothetical protein
MHPFDCRGKRRKKVTSAVDNFLVTRPNGFSDAEATIQLRKPERSSSWLAGPSDELVEEQVSLHQICKSKQGRAFTCLC